MKNKGIIRNVNKKILAGALSLTIMSTCLAGCGEKQGSRYCFDCVITDDKGQVSYTDDMPYSIIWDYKVVVFEKNEKTSIYICRVVQDSYGHRYKFYYNVFDGVGIYNTTGNSDLHIVSEELLSDYLVMYDKVKESYTAAEIEEILEQIKQDYSKDKDKTLVKK